MTPARALVLRAPGINRDHDLAHACQLAGFEVDLLHINQLIKEPARLLAYHLLGIPGGFSYGDDLGGGTLLAKNISVHLSKELQRFVDEGHLVIGICNGFQALVRAGLLPGAWADDTPGAAATLTENASAQFECRWISVAPQPGPCVFTRGLVGPLEMPAAHGEGQFVLARQTELVRLQESGQVALVYTINARSATPSPTAPSLLEQAVPYPANPNGSQGNIAGICNARGTVFGLMPHPENFVHALQHPQRRDGCEGPGDGLLLFQNAYRYVQEQLLAPVSYASSGVDIAAADEALALMKDAVSATHGPEVLAGMGAFAGVFQATALQKMRRPALVASTDGVGTKTLLAAQTGRFASIGYDIVNHSLNDLLTQKATPLFFMDYVATGKLAPAHIAAVVESVARACREAGCALLGGETAEMPGVYHNHAFDLVGTIVGAVDLAENWQNGATIRAGDVLLGLPSNGLHTNGYSLARRVFASYELETVFPELGESLADALLRPHRSYLRELQALHRQVTIKGLAHITGGGFAGNIARILPAGCQARIATRSWQVPPLFQLLARLGKIADEEMYRTFNMGIGMVLVLTPDMAAQARRVLPELLAVGTIAEGSGVILQGIEKPMTNQATLGPLLAEGKTKQIYAHPTDDALAYMVNKDQITAGDGERRNALVGKSRWSTITMANIYRLLNSAGIATHLVDQVDDVTVLIRRCTMLPVEQVMRRIATGSYLKRTPGAKEGDRFDPVLVETFLKDDANHDPQIWEEDIIARGLASKEEIDWMAAEGRRVFEVLERAWASVDVALIDLKIEFGRDVHGRLLVADVIDNDSWRIWPGGDKNRMLDKQIYRNLKEVTEQDLQALGDRYALVADLTGKLKVS